MYGKRVTKATLLTLDEALRSWVFGWIEIWPARSMGPEENYLEPVFLCFGKIKTKRGMRMDLRRVPQLYNSRRPGVRIWAGPPPTDKERAAAPWDV